MSDVKNMEIDRTNVDQTNIQKEEETVNNLLEAAKKEIRAVKEINAVNLKKAREKAKLDLAIPLRSKKVALLYRRALNEKKQLLGLEPEPSKVKFLAVVLLLTKTFQSKGCIFTQVI